MTTTFDSDINEEMAGVTEETPDITEYHVVGPPGCGKTTWLSRQVRRAVNTGQQVLISSLTRAAAAEVAGRDLPIPPESLGTLHSHCFQSLGRPEIAEAKKYVTEWNETYPNYCLSLGTNDLGTRIDGDNLEPTAGGTLGDRLMAEYQLARARMSTQLTPNASLFADKWEAWKKDRFLLDFTDLIQTCLQDVDYAPSGPDIIFVDEAQDMDLLEMSLIRKWGTNAGYLIVVGDPDQSIYTWRGADPQAFTSAASANPKNMVLAQSYRVPFQVHGHAVRWINNIVSRQPVEYLPTEELGEVRSIPADWAEPKLAIKDAARYLDEGKSVMFLSTCAYMLKPTIEALRNEGIPFHNPHRRTNGAWNPLGNRRNQSSASDRLLHFLAMHYKGAWSLEQLDNWLKSMKATGVYASEGRQFIKIVQNETDGLLSWEAMNQVLTDDAIDAGMTADLHWYQEHLRSDKLAGSRFPLQVARLRSHEELNKTPKIVVGTIHSIKGSEADAVYVFPDISKAGFEEWNGPPSQKASVYRLFYVAMTRAKESLILCSKVEHGHAVDF